MKGHYLKMKIVTTLIIFDFHHNITLSIQTIKNHCAQIPSDPFCILQILLLHANNNFVSKIETKCKTTK